jgi:hypothetical protein
MQARVAWSVRFLTAEALANEYSFLVASLARETWSVSLSTAALWTPRSSSPRATLAMAAWSDNLRTAERRTLEIGLAREKKSHQTSAQDAEIPATAKSDRDFISPAIQP